MTSLPRSVTDEIITTGVGRARISRSRNSRPFILGISTSSVITSGFRSRIMSRASYASAAAPTTSMSACSAQDVGEHVADHPRVVDDEDPDGAHLNSSAAPSIGPWKSRAP